MSVDTRPPQVADGVVGSSTPGWRQRRRAGGQLGKLLPPFVTFVVFLGLLVPGERGAARRGPALPAAAAARGRRRSPSSTRSTGRRCCAGCALSTAIAMVGLAIAIVLGVAIGIAMSQARWVERSLYPYAVVLQCIPTWPWSR